MTLSRNQITDLNSNEPDGVYLFLLDVETVNASSGAVEKIGSYINNTEDVTIRGVKYLASPFSISLPSSGDSERGLRELSLPLYDPSFINTIRQAIPGAVSQKRLVFKLKMVSNADYNTSLAGDFSLSCFGVTFNQEAIIFSIGFDNLSDISWPIHTFDKDNYNGLF